VKRTNFFARKKRCSLQAKENRKLERKKKFSHKMKPTVINGGNTSENSNPNVPQTTSNNVQSDTNNNTNRINNDPRGFPPSFSAREFGFDDSDDDIFSDMGLRSRMNRMGHPFDWGVRKRRGSTGHTEPQPNAYEQFFPDEPDFAGFGAPHWDNFNANRKRNQHPTADRSGFFDYLPQEFRQYMPEHFGFSNMRQNPQTTQGSSAFQKPPHPQQQQQYHPQQQQQQQQYHPQQQQQQFQQPQQIPTSPKPNLCDAAIQTEDIENEPQTQANNLKQHGLRNTVDLGRKSQQEEIKTEGRAHSAPPREDLVAQQKNAYQTDNHPNISQDTYGAANNSSYSNTGTSMTPQCNVPQPQFNAAQYQQQRQQDQQQQQPSQPQNTQPHGQYTRSVPIFVEGRSVPIVNKINIPQENLDQSHSNQSHQQSQQRQETPTQQSPKTQNRPAPFVAKENVPQPTAEESQIPPQTPHTTDCINKIQDIQRDVLDLMGKVERFGGLKGDKEYMYLDEMLTRNLLKLDTIDTNGKESIRLARKEAIKCIQASIAVMDAKSEINARPKENETEKAEAAAEPSADAEVENTTEATEKPKKTASGEALDKPKLVSELQINLRAATSNETIVPEVGNSSSNVDETENEKPNEENVSKEQ
jgi:BCL2-associated athanogene 3